MHRVKLKTARLSQYLAKFTNMKKLNIIYICFVYVLLFSMCSCDIYKKSSKTKSDTDTTEQIETKTFRKGDTVTYQIPNIVLKDTTIYTYNRQGTTLKTVYNTQGQISQVDCFSSAIEEFKKENRQILETIKQKDSEKKEEMNTDWIMYGFIMIGVVLMFAFLLFYFYIKSQTASFTAILEKLSK